MDGEEQSAARHLAALLEKMERDRYECQELLACTSTHWLLSTDEFKSTVDPPHGLISQLTASIEPRAFFLVPHESGVPRLDMRELHQIVRELVYGIYVFNQIPTISLEPNFDQSTSCQIPPAYLDTRLGQIMIEVDYMLKALWHGAYFPRDKRLKFSERWRTSLDVSAAGHPETKKDLLFEFTNAGMVDLSTDCDYARAIEDFIASEPVDVDSDENSDRRTFSEHTDEFLVRINLQQKTVRQIKNIYIVDSDWCVTSSVMAENEDAYRSSGKGGWYQRVNARLRRHKITLEQHLCNKPEIKQKLFMLKIVSFLVPLFVALKRKQKIPDLNRLLATMTGEEVRTERDLPPLFLGSQFKCQNFRPSSSYVHLHGGIVMNLDTPSIAMAEQSFLDAYEEINAETSAFAKKYIDGVPTFQEYYPASSITVNEKSYYVFALDFVTYYPQSPQRPRWVQGVCEEMAKLRLKKLPITDIQIHDLFKKYLGYTRALQCRYLAVGLRQVARRGLVATFAALSRKCPSSHLTKADELGMSLIHYTAVYNRPHILASLISFKVDTNTRKITVVFGAEPESEETATGPTPLLLASRSGSLDVVACLVSTGVNLLLTDKDGWAAIHCAAYYDHACIVQLLAHKNPSMLELPTRNESKRTPVLLAACSGALSSVKCLIDLGANVLCRDAHGLSIVHQAATGLHTNVLQFFITWDNPKVNVWAALVEMIQSSSIKIKEAAVRCLEILTSSNPHHYWSSILNAGGIEALVSVLTVDNVDLQRVATAVLCNISDHPPICHALTSTPEAIRVIVSLLTSRDVDVQSRAAVVLADMASLQGNSDLISSEGCITSLIRMLDSTLEGVVVTSVNALRVLCTDNPSNQSTVSKAGAIPYLVEFLTIDSDVLQSAAAEAIAELCRNNRENQDSVMNEGSTDECAAKALLSLVRGYNIAVQIKAALAIECLAESNELIQGEFIDLDATKALLRLLKMFALDAKEQAACTLWALSGQTSLRQRYIAEEIGIPILIEMLLRDSEKLQYVGCCAMMALGREDMDSQNRVAEHGGLQPLVRILRLQKSSARVLLCAVRALSAFCVGVAYRNNRVSQTRIAEENAIPILVQLMTEPGIVAEDSKEGRRSRRKFTLQLLQVEVAYTLGCIVLGNNDNHQKLADLPAFNFFILRDLLNSRYKEISLKAGFGLAVFAFNNTPQQLAIRHAGGLKLEKFESFLTSEDPQLKATAAFQIVVLSRVIIDSDHVTMTARGIKCLVDILRLDDNDAIILTAGLVSSLAHTRAGVTDAMITLGVLPVLIDRLCNSSNEQVRRSCSVALGYMSYNRTASRHLISFCRNQPQLYPNIIANIGPDPKLSTEFVSEFERAVAIGLPCLSLEIYGGPTTDGRRPATAQSLRLSSLRCSASMSRASSVLTRCSTAPQRPSRLDRARSAPMLITPTVAPILVQRTVPPTATVLTAAMPAKVSSVSPPATAVLAKTKPAAIESRATTAPVKRTVLVSTPSALCRPGRTNDSFF